MKKNVPYRVIKLAEETLSKIAQEPLPGRLACKVASLLRKVAEHLSDLEKARIALVKKHGIEDEQGNWSIPADNEEAVQAFRSDFFEALDVEVEIELLSGDIVDHIKISPAEAMLLEPLLDE